MKYVACLLFVLTFWGCNSPIKSSDGNTTSQKEPVQNNLSCDSLLQILVRRGDPKIQSWEEINVSRRNSDSIFIKVFATNGKADTIIANWIVFLPIQNRLQDITLYPAFLKDLPLDEETFRIIKNSCNFSN